MLDTKAGHFSYVPNPDSSESSEPGLPDPLTSVTNTFAQWLQANRHRYLRYLRGRLPSTEDAEDALQDTAVKFFQNAGSLNKLEKRDAWVGTSLRHTVIDRYRRSATQRRLTEALLREPPDACDDQEDAAITAAECIKATIPAIKVDFAILLQQVYFDGMSVKDVAKREAITENNATVRLHRARSALRQTMRRQCKNCPIIDCWGQQRLQPATRRAGAI